MIRKGLTILTAVASICGLGLLSVPAFAGTLEWSGTVDDTATIRLTDQRVHVRANHKGVKDEHEMIQGRLPEHPVLVELSDVRGRGDVKIIEQPDERNNFTAVVRIWDKQPGSDRYHFILHWDRDSDNALPAPPPGP